MQVTARVVGEPFLDHLGAGLLGILINGATLHAIDEEIDITAVIVGDIQMASDPEGGLLGLRGAVVAEVADARDHEVGRAQQ